MSIMRAICVSDGERKEAWMRILCRNAIVVNVVFIIHDEIQVPLPEWTLLLIPPSDDVEFLCLVVITLSLFDMYCISRHRTEFTHHKGTTKFR